MDIEQQAKMRRGDAVWRWRHERISWRVEALLAKLRAWKAAQS